ncbi:MAG TPA: hypothetical protein VFE59_29375 [Trebonia sp.]|nr:hypothetical protein [Trebonia sp.]
MRPAGTGTARALSRVRRQRMFYASAAALRRVAAYVEALLASGPGCLFVTRRRAGGRI